MKPITKLTALAAVMCAFAVPASAQAEITASIESATSIATSDSGDSESAKRTRALYAATNRRLD